MEKRGLGHIEMVLSVILFVTAVIFAIYFFTAQINNSEKYSALDFSYTTVIRELSENVNTYSIKINEDNIPSGKEVIAIKLDRIIENDEGVAVFDISNNLLQSRVSGDIIYVNINSAGSLIFIKISKAIERRDSNIVESPEFDESFYQLGSNKNEVLLSEMKLREMNRTYYNDYTKLKADLLINRGFDLGIIVKFSDNEMVKMEKNVPSPSQVFAKTKRNEFLRIDGKNVFADMEVKVW